MRAPICIALSMLASVASCHAQAEAPQLPGALRCEFESYASAVAEKTEVQIKAAIRPEPGIDPLIFAAFDPANGSAQLVGNIGSSPVSLIATGITWSFVEVTDAGNVNVTQVFLFDEPEAEFDRYRAIHSRHSSIAGVIVASQHYGHCKALK